MAYANWLFAKFLPAPIPTEDSYGYLAWSLFRTIGYPALLSAYDMLTPTWEYFPLVQLNMILAGLVALCWGTARATGSYLLGWLVLALTAASARVPLFAAYLMTEGPFAAMLMLHLGLMYVALTGGSRLPAVGAGMALAAATLVKSVGIVMAAPGMLLFVLLPARRLALAVAVAPALVAWLVPSAANLVRHGFFEGSVAGGYALAGHVAWAIHPHARSPHPELAARLEKRLAPVFARRPRWGGSRDHYVSYTSDEYNILLWQNIVPETVAYLGPQCPGGYFETCTWEHCAAPCSMQSNRLLMDLGRDAIRAQPTDYAYHVLAHGERTWRLVFQRPVELLVGTAERATELPFYYPYLPSVSALLEPVPKFRTREEVSVLEKSLSGSPLKVAADLFTLNDAVRRWLVEPLNGPAGRLLAWIALAACVLVMRVPRLTPSAIAFCYTGLCLNAYVLGTALFQPALERYSWPLQGATAALLATGLGAAIAAAAAYRRGRRSRIAP